MVVPSEVDQPSTDFQIDEDPYKPTEASVTQAQTEPPTTTPLPIASDTVDGCRLPLYPMADPDQHAENAWRFG